MDTHPTHNRAAVLVAILLAFSFAIMGVWVRMMGKSFGPFQQVYLRILLAGVFSYYAFRPKRSKTFFQTIDTHEWTIYGMRAFMGYTVGVAAFTIAIQHTDLGVVSFVSSVPLLGLLAWLLYREELPKVSLPFVLLSIAGLLLVTGSDIHKVHFGVGEVASVIGMLGFDMGYLMSRMHKKTRNNYENTTVLLLIGWVPVFIISLLKHEALLPHSVTWAAIVGLVCSAIQNVAGLYATNYVFTNIKGYVAGNILLLEGLFAVMLGYFLYGEPVTAPLMLGGFIIAACAFAINHIEQIRSNASETE